MWNPRFAKRKLYAVLTFFSEIGAYIHESDFVTDYKEMFATVEHIM
jgi:hypothetical protein